MRKLLRAVAAQSEGENATAALDDRRQTSGWDCESGSGVRFVETCRIRNNFGSKQAIRIGKHSLIAGELLTFGHGGRIEIGEYCFVGEGSRIWSAELVHIGNRVLISHGVNIIDTDSHSLNAQERHQHFVRVISDGHPTNPEEMKNVRSSRIDIGDDCWISFGASILKGVTIGERSVVGAGAIVTKDVPPDSLYLCKVTPIISAL